MPTFRSRVQFPSPAPILERWVKFGTLLLVKIYKMTIIPKIKKIKKIYAIKIKIRNIKNLFKSIIYLFSNRTDLEKIINFIKHFFKVGKIKIDIKRH